MARATISARSPVLATCGRSELGWLLTVRAESPNSSPIPLFERPSATAWRTSTSRVDNSSGVERPRPRCMGMTLRGAEVRTDSGETTYPRTPAPRAAFTAYASSRPVRITTRRHCIARSSALIIGRIGPRRWFHQRYRSWGPSTPTFASASSRLSASTTLRAPYWRRRCPETPRRAESDETINAVNRVRAAAIGSSRLFGQPKPQFSSHVRTLGRAREARTYRQYQTVIGTMGSGLNGHAVQIPVARWSLRHQPNGQVRRHRKRQTSRCHFRSVEPAGTL